MEENILRKKKNRILTGSFSALIFFLLFSAHVSAQEKNGLIVSPAFQEVVLGENQNALTIKFSVANLTDTTAALDASFADPENLDSSGKFYFSSDKNKKRVSSESFGLARWTEITQPEIILLPGEKKEVNVLVRNSSDLSPGGHYGAVLLQWKGQSVEDNNKPVLKPIISSIVLLRKMGGEKKEMALSRISLDGKFYTFPKNAEFVFRNLGNVHLVPRGVVSIEDPFGRTVFKSAINSESSYVFPERSKTLKLAMNDLFHLPISGKYRATIDYRFDGKEDFARREMDFYYFNPLHAGILLLVIMIFSAIVLRNPLKNSFKISRKQSSKRVISKKAKKKTE